MQNSKEVQPADSITDNLTHDLIDSFITGIAAQFIVNYAFGKSPSFKNVLNKNTLIDGTKNGAAIATFRRIGRPALNQMMNRTPGLGDIMKL